MKTLPKIEIARLNNTIALHLNLRVPFAESHRSEMPFPPHHAESGTAPHGAANVEIDFVLYNLLLRYVDLLESPDHGGWTREEDEAVREAVTLLAHSDAHLRLPQGVH